MIDEQGNEEAILPPMFTESKDIVDYRFDYKEDFNLYRRIFDYILVHRQKQHPNIHHFEAAYLTQIIQYFIFVKKLSRYINTQKNKTLLLEACYAENDVSLHLSVEGLQGQLNKPELLGFFLRKFVSIPMVVTKEVLQRINLIEITIFKWQQHVIYPYSFWLKPFSILNRISRLSTDQSYDLSSLSMNSILSLLEFRLKYFSEQFGSQLVNTQLPVRFTGIAFWNSTYYQYISF